MKKCPKCGKLFDDNIEQCDIDNVTLIEIKSEDALLLDKVKNLDINAIEYIKQSYFLLKKNPQMLLGGFLVMLLISGGSTLLNIIPILGGSIQIGITGALAGGYIRMIYKVFYGETTTINDLFSCFNKFTIFLLTILIAGILTSLGFILLIIPGIYLMIAYKFSFHLIALNNFSYWQALETSRKIITRKWFSFFIFFIILVFLNLLGFLLIGIGILITLPISFIAMTLLYINITKEIGLMYE